MSTRLEKPFSLKIPDTELHHVVHSGGQNRAQLVVLIGAKGVRAHWPADSSFDNPPEFIGTLTAYSGGTMLAGSIRESRASRLWSRIMAIPTALLCICIVIGVVVIAVKGTSPGLPPLLIGAIGTPLSALSWRWQRRIRGPAFEQDAARLSEGIERYVTTGENTRWF